MNRRIRKKKDKKITEAINGLISIADWQERQRQDYPKVCETVRSPVRAATKGEIDAVTKKKTTYMIRAPTGKSITPTLKN